jgi:predicted HTH transcriptional regulator
MPDPRAVFEHPEAHWDFFTVSDHVHEQADCCVYDARDLDRSTLTEFTKVFLLDSSYEYSNEELLYQVGAINRASEGYNFTNAGLLFFAANPQRVSAAAYIRLLRFETNVENMDDRGLPTFDRKFTGPITKQVRDIRTFFRASGFFKLYQRRNPDGGFTEEPEYPLIAVDEAIVNAVAHREYAIGLPIECESYHNAFVVRNPGRLQQRDRDVPAQFSLETMRLNSAPRNPKLIEWLKMMRDERGAEFVRALSEGTRRMRDEMKRLSLPAPIYKMSESQTTVVLFNNSQEREAALRSSLISQMATIPTVDGSVSEPVEVDRIETVSSLVNALQDIPQACLQVGSLLMVKTTGADGRPIVSTRTLTALELRLLEGNQLMLGDPDRILEWLNNSENDLVS